MSNKKSWKASQKERRQLQQQREQRTKAVESGSIKLPEVRRDRS